MPEAPTLSQVVALLEHRAHPDTAEEWDRVGLVTGDPQQQVTRVLFAVDATPEVVAQAVSAGVDLLVTHHPLLLRGVSSVAQTSSRGRTLAALIRAGCALLTMHTNADQATDGVNDALADACGMVADRAPIRPLPGPAQVRVVVHVPGDHVDGLVAAMAAAGAGVIGDYESCAFWVEGTGQFRPTAAASPAIGEPGRLSQVAELRVEMVAPAGSVAAVRQAIDRVHPYEEPAVSVVPLVSEATPAGLGRVGDVAAVDLAGFARRLAGALPAPGVGVRVAGDPDRLVRRVAVCSGAGDSLLGDVASLDVDAYVTSDLRHHPALDFIVDSDVALVDIPHASGESLWLSAWAQQLVVDAATRGWRLTAEATTLNTDPWTFHVPTPAEDHS